MSEDSRDIKDRSDTHAGRIIYGAGAIAAAGGTYSMARGAKHHISNTAKKLTGKTPAARPKLARIRKGGAAVALGLAAVAVGHGMIQRTYQHTRTNRNDNT